MEESSKNSSDKKNEFVSWYQCAKEELPDFLDLYPNISNRNFLGTYSLIVVATGEHEPYKKFRAMYAKSNKQSYSKTNVLFETDGNTIEEAVGDLCYWYNHLKAKGQIVDTVFYKSYYDEAKEQCVEWEGTLSFCDNADVIKHYW